MRQQVKLEKMHHLDLKRAFGYNGVNTSEYKKKHFYNNTQ